MRSIEDSRSNQNELRRKSGNVDDNRSVGRDSSYRGSDRPLAKKKFKDESEIQIPSHLAGSSNQIRRDSVALSERSSIFEEMSVG